MPGASSSLATKVWESPYTREMDATISGRNWDPAKIRIEYEIPDARRATSELRRISGLTWKQLGELFNVSRRNIHFWANG